MELSLQSIQARVSGGSVRYGGRVFRPHLDASYLNGKIMVFALYYTPVDPVEVDGVLVASQKWLSDFICLWGTVDMLQIMQSKGWVDRWKQEDIELLRHPDTGSRLGVLMWRAVDGYS